MSVLYLDHFELKADPFRITPDIDFFFSGGRRGDILEGLVVAALHDDGIVCVIGEIGMGKTMLSRMLMERLRDHPVDTVYLPNPVFDRNEILDAIGRDLLGAPLRGSRTEMVVTLEKALIQRHGEGRRVVVVIDEAHSMPPGTLEEIRLLSNLETTQNKLLKIMLFGQPELDAVLKATNLRQVKDRISFRFDLHPLTHPEIAGYLDFRLRKAGFRGSALFTPEAVRRLAAACGGRTRRLNMLADKSLLAAFAANAAVVQGEHIERACADEEPGLEPHRAVAAQATPPRAAWPAWQVLAGVGAALALGGVGGFLVSQYLGSGPAAIAGRAPPPAEPAALPPVAASSAPLPAAVADAAMTAASASASAVALASPPALPASAAESLAQAVAVATAPAPAPASEPAAAVAAAIPTAARMTSASAPGARTLEQRMQATERAMRETRGAGFTLQLVAMRAPNRNALETALTTYEKLLGPDAVLWVNDRVYGGVLHHAVYTGHFTTREEAQKAAAALPEPIRQHRPVPRSLQKLLEESGS